MGYRHYIASVPKSNANCKINDVIHTMVTENDDDNYFNPDVLIRSISGQIEIELGNEPIIGEIKKKCNSYIPDEVVTKYSEYLPENNKDERFIGILSKELLMEYIRNLHHNHLSSLEKKYEACVQDKEYAKNYAISKLAYERVKYETSLDFLNDKALPYCVEESFDYFIYQLFQLYTITDFKTIDLVVYGW